MQSVHLSKTPFSPLSSMNIYFASITVWLGDDETESQERVN